MTRDRSRAAPIVLGVTRLRELRAAGRIDAPRRKFPSLLYFWVREAYRLEALWDDAQPSAIAAALAVTPVWFESDCGAPAEQTRSAYGYPFGQLRAAITMPRWASRYMLRRDGDALVIAEDRTRPRSAPAALAGRSSVRSMIGRR